MIHIVTEDNRRLYTAAFGHLEQLIGDARGDAGVLAGGVDTTHLLALDHAGRPEFACRLRAFQDVEDLQDELFALVDGGLEALARSKVLECERIFTAPSLYGPEPEARKRNSELRLAVLEQAHDLGADRIVRFIELNRLSTALGGSPRPRILGLPGWRGGAWVIAIDMDASAVATEALRESLALEPSRRLRLKPGETAWAAEPGEIETFLSAAQTLPADRLGALLEAVRKAVEDDDGSDN